MAVWVSLLKKVPWNQVINNAPLLVDGAKKLWKSVNNKNTDEEQIPAKTNILTSGGDKLKALDDTVKELKSQLFDSSALIKALADQNVELVKNLENQRKITLALSIITALMSLAVTIILIKLF